MMISDDKLFEIATNKKIPFNFQARAVSLISDEKYLLEILKDNNEFLSIISILNHNFKNLDEYLTSSNDTIRAAAVANVNFNNQEIIKDLALNEKDDSVRIAAIKKLEDRNLFEKIVLSDSNDYIRNMLIDFIFDESLLEKIALNDSNRNNSQKAFKKSTYKKLICNRCGSASIDIMNGGYYCIECGGHSVSKTDNSYSLDMIPDFKPPFMINKRFLNSFHEFDLETQRFLATILDDESLFYLAEKGHDFAFEMLHGDEMKVMFVCSANTCRSPMAEVILKSLNNHIDVYSAGISPTLGMKASDNAVAVCGNYGLDLTKHTAISIGDSDIGEMDLVLTATSMIRDELKSIYGDLEIYTIKEYAGYGDGLDISDPFGDDLNTYEKCFLEIREALMKCCCNGLFTLCFK